jgi:hypothetical protein
MADVVQHIKGGRIENRPDKLIITEDYRVYLDGTTADTKYSAEAAVRAVVARGTAHPDYSGALARSYSTAAEGGTGVKRTYVVTISYESPEPGQIFGDPVLDAPRIRFGGRKETRIAVKDKDGNPVVNSAYHWFVPPYEIDTTPLTISIERNETTVVGDTIRSYRDSVNNASVTIAGMTLAARRALMSNWEAASFTRDGYDRWAHSYTIEIAEGTWDVELLDQGMFYFDSANKKRRIEIGDEPTEEPQRLDGSGGKLAPDALPSASQYITFRLRKETNWSTLSLPSTV